MSPALYVLSVFYYCMVIFLLWCLKIWFEKKAFAIYINIIFILIKKRKSEKKKKKRSHIHFSFLLCSKITSMLFLEPQFSRKIWGRHWLYFLNSFLLGFVIHSSFFFFGGIYCRFVSLFHHHNIIFPNLMCLLLKLHLHSVRLYHCNLLFSSWKNFIVTWIYLWPY